MKQKLGPFDFSFYTRLRGMEPIFNFLSQGFVLLLISGVKNPQNIKSQQSIETKIFRHVKRKFHLSSKLKIRPGSKIRKSEKQKIDFFLLN